MSILLAVAASYLLGSISPSFFLGKLVKGIDIREHGDGNAGGANTLATVGVVPGILTAVFDVSKGLIALALASSVFGLSGNLLMLPIAAALAGHVFPFYLQFRGGQGAGTAVGVFGYVLVLLIASGKLPWEAVVLVFVIGAVVAIVTPAVEFIGVAMIPLLIYEVLHFTGFAFPSSAGALLLVYLLGVTSYNFLRKGILRSDTVRERNWAIIGVAVVGTAVLLLLCLERRPAAAIAAIAGSLALFVAAFAQRRRARGVRGEARPGTADPSEGAPLQGDDPSETNKNPDRTGLAVEGALFFLGAFLVTVLYPRSTACLALSLLVGGKIFSELFGSDHGFRAVPGASTFRRAVVFLCGCLAVGEIVSSSLGMTLPPLLAGAAAAFVAALLVPRPYETAVAALFGGFVLWAIGVPLL